MAKAAQLHEVLAVLSDLKTQAKKISTETANVLAKKPEHFRGMTKSSKMFDEARSNENMSDTKEMVTTVTDKLKHMSSHMSRYYDALLQMEATNQHATADLVVDNVVLGANLPSTFLLGLESRLTELREVYALIPTLDPGIPWTLDTADGREGVYTASSETLKTEKSIEAVVLYAATTEHPAQVKERTIDKVCGKITTTNTTSMWTPLAKSELMERVDKLIRATKKARQRANSAELVKAQIGNNIFEYILTGAKAE